MTQRIAEQQGWDISFTRGVTPFDVGEAMRSQGYDLVFIDGEHTDVQIFEDFASVRARLAPRSVVVFHDVWEFCMELGFQAVLDFTA